MTWSAQQDAALKAVAKYGRWTVVQEHAARDKDLCRCDCGTEKLVFRQNLRRGLTLSCGCLRAETTARTKTIHGHSKTSGKSPEYAAYRDMLARCKYENRPAFRDYGARGITVCERWKGGEDGKTGFECFLDDVGLRPSAGHTLERRFNDAGYGPNNVVWATRLDQARNTRRNLDVDFGGGVDTLSKLVEQYGAAGYGTIYSRIVRGWDHEEAIITPPGASPSVIVCPF